ncbi:Nucleolar protein 12 [Apiospora rasikravindrae]|uniref:Nucleolar protein 12 n=1 Tax=Apiospora rasikravindrae TaxID=990691 RepID=A0ABR1UBF9_9PEZI
MGSSKRATLAASKDRVDPTLDALFASSSGPVKAPPPSRYESLLLAKGSKAERQGGADNSPSGDDESISQLDSEEEGSVATDLEIDHGSEDESVSGTEPEDVTNPAPDAATSDFGKKDRKRKRKDVHDDLESKYMSKLVSEEDDRSHGDKRRKGESGQAVTDQAPEPVLDDEDVGDDTPIIHESLRNADDGDASEIDKANRTLFLGNVSAEAINSTKAKKQLIAHLGSSLSGLDQSTGPHKVVSLRFRSTAFGAGSIPKRAAFITKSLMSSTTKSTNAYVVYSTLLAARTALKALNGSVILDRHLRVDSVAHPTPVDHRRCVFVGNLGFVDDETIVETNAEGETVTKKRSKVPADIEEGLWRVFEKAAGKVESVRVPRDPKTRVGKGFAYVQFYDGNHVEAALLLEGKKFPPMLPRILRVSRAKDPRKTALNLERSMKLRAGAVPAETSKGSSEGSKSTKYKFKATPEQQSLAGRAGRLLGRAGAARQQREIRGYKGKSRGDGPATGSNADTLNIMKTPEQIVFEGRRASAKDGKPRDLKLGKGKGNRTKKSVTSAKPGRGAKRAAEWRKKGSGKPSAR